MADEITWFYYAVYLGVGCWLVGSFGPTEAWLAPLGS